MTHTTRALELLFQAIREVESRDELRRLSATAQELYGGRGHDETFHTLMLAIDSTIWWRTKREPRLMT